MNIGLDLRLVETRTLEVVDVISYQKQIVGHEIGAGVFSFLATGRSRSRPEKARSSRSSSPSAPWSNAP